MAVNQENIRTADISIIIPAYNEETYIYESVKSALQQQSTKDFEVLVCDDASSDRTGQILSELCRENETLRLLQNHSNRGIIKTVNRLTEAAEGDFLLRVDADSILLPGTLQAMYDEFKNGSDLVFGRVKVKNTHHLHPTTAAISKVRGRGTWYGGACIGVDRAKFTQTGGFKDNMLGAEVQELKRRADVHGWTVSRLDKFGVESHFPTDMLPALWRKFDSGRTHVNQYLDMPESFNIWELRGPIFWTLLFMLIGGSLFSLPLAVLASAMVLLPIFQYARDAKLAVSISGKKSFFVLYPLYQIVGAVLRTVGVWANIESIFVVLVRRYLV